MANIVYRKVTDPGTNAATAFKGSPLTNDELDKNFYGLNAEITSKAPLNSPAFTGAVTGGSFNGVTGLSGVVGTTLGTASIGSSTAAARADHVHPLPTRTALGASTIGSNMFTLSNPSAVTFPRFNADNTVSALTAAEFLAAIGGGSGGGGSGTVTSVGLSMPSIFTVTNSPVTTTGTLTATLASQTANKFFASPSGASGVPTFRSITSTDIPFAVLTIGDQAIAGNKQFQETVTVTKRPGIGNAFVTGTSDSSTFVVHVVNPGGGVGDSYLTLKRTDDVGGFSTPKSVNVGLDDAGRFVIGGGTSATATRMTLDQSGNLIATGNVSAGSDARIKKDLSPILDALQKLNQLTGYTFTRIDTGARQTGVVAQEVQKVLPEAVIENEQTGMLSVAYGNMAGLLIEAIKELNAKVESLQERMDSK